MANEIIKINNELNRKPLRLTAVESDFLMIALWEAKNKGKKTLKYSFDEVKALSKYRGKDTQQFYDDLCLTQEKFARLLYSKKDDTSYKTYPLFAAYETNRETKTVKLKVNPVMMYILNDWLGGNFTAFKLDDYLTLKSKHEKSLFRLLKRYRTSGIYTTTLNNLIELLDIKKYSVKDITYKILKPAVKNLQKYFTGLRYVTRKEKRKITHITFVFRKEKNNYIELDKPKKKKYDDKTKVQKYADVEKKIIKAGEKASTEMLAFRDEIKDELKNMLKKNYIDLEEIENALEEVNLSAEIFYAKN